MSKDFKFSDLDGSFVNFKITESQVLHNMRDLTT